MTVDAVRSRRFYCALLDLRPTGEFPVVGSRAASLFELPHIRATNHWLAGSRQFFQIELFEFEEPEPSATNPGQGYNCIVVEVADAESTICSLASQGLLAAEGTWLCPCTGHALLRDPDGVLIELIGGGRQRSTSGRVVGVRAEASEPQDARRYFVEALGMRPDGPESMRLYAGEYWLELSPRAADSAHCSQPPALARPGIMNIALGMRQPADFWAVYRRVLKHGYRSATEPIGNGISHVVYVRTEHGLSVELLQLPAFLDAVWGFARPGLCARLAQWAIRALARSNAVCARPANFESMRKEKVWM
ncbi:hypothetical protein NKT35_10240 [Chromobacterium sp. IIBBL 290-4]|nr:VOC family protein [Chromobacterium sp. IIBBL 290-4]UTH76450.1 hypothetical protein NKT35_10240 [Chromobacterium sp. IIBBL 290-4]